MRIAHVTDVYLPRLGGVELQVRDLAAHQRRLGHDPLIVTTTPGGPGHDEGSVIRVGRGAAVGPYRAVRARTLATVLRAHRIEAVHAHVSVLSPLAWSAAGLAGTTGLPTVVSVHSMWHDLAPAMRSYLRVRAAARWPVVWAAVSTAAASAVRHALAGPPVTVLPNGIDPAAWLMPIGPREPAVPEVVSVMRMVRRKRPRALLRTLLALRAQYPGRFRATLVGGGPLLPRLQHDIAAAEAEHDIRLTGPLDRPAIRTLLAGADLYIAPALRESFGIAALEARSAGVPVLARAGSGVADFVRDGVEGWLVHSDEHLYATAAALLDEARPGRGAEPGRLATVARHNRTVAPLVHWDAVLERADALYAAAGARKATIRALR
jgi:glycosyltransferase involved in cell wall biosynthesis